MDGSVRSPEGCGGCGQGCESTGGGAVRGARKVVKQTVIPTHPPMSAGRRGGVVRGVAKCRCLCG